MQSSPHDVRDLKADVGCILDEITRAARSKVLKSQNKGTDGEDWCTKWVKVSAMWGNGSQAR
jgi:hypothetical protein